jgi:AcrR family transcriptional regulator
MASEKKSAYHHGDLRAALIQEGLRLLEERRGDDVGLREVARAAGVSATAVYRHFPDKAALLRALSSEGLARLAEAQRRAFSGAGGGKAGFLATGRAYVAFALANPALFRLAFSSANCSQVRRTRCPKPSACYATTPLSSQRPALLPKTSTSPHSRHGRSSTASRCWCSTGRCRTTIGWSMAR